MAMARCESCPSRKPDGAVQQVPRSGDSALWPAIRASDANGKWVERPKAHLCPGAEVEACTRWPCSSGSGGASFVVAIEAAGFRDLDDGLTEIEALHRSRRWAVHGEGAVATPRVIVAEVVAEEPPEVALA